MANSVIQRWVFWLWWDASKWWASWCRRWVVENLQRGIWIDSPRQHRHCRKHLRIRQRSSPEVQPQPRPREQVWPEWRPKIRRPEQRRWTSCLFLCCSWTAFKLTTFKRLIIFVPFHFLFIANPTEGVINKTDWVESEDANVFN